MILVSGATGNVGGALVAELAAAGHPVRALSRRAPVRPRPGGLEGTAGDLDDPASLEPALARARAIDDEISAFDDALAVAREASRISRRPARGHLRLYADAACQVDYAVRNVRVLACAAIAKVRERGPVTFDLAGAVATLAAAVRSLATELAEPSGEAETRRLAHLAATEATAVLELHSDLRSNMIVGQVRSTALDLLRGTGLDIGAARATIGSPT